MRKSTCRPAFGTRPRPADCFWSGGLLDRRTKRSDPSAAQPTALARFIRSCGEARQRGWASQVLSGRALRHVRAPINGAPGARCSRAAQLPLLLAHVCALALTLSVLSHSYARLSFRRLARVLIARSTVVERRITYYLGDYLYYDDVEVVNALGQFLELDARA